MARFKVAVQRPTNVTYALGGGGYDYEMEYLSTIDAEIVEFEASSEGEFIEQVKDCDALIARGDRVSANIIENLQNCKIIALGSVGADTVDVGAATARNIPVTNVPDTFIEEVADHTMMLLLATFRRLTLMDKYTRDHRWGEGRPYLNQFPRLFGQTLGFVSFGHVARATAIRAQPFGLRMIAFDPYIEELTMTSYGVEPVSLDELMQRSDIVSMHAPSTSEVHHLLTERHFRMMKPTALFINNGRGPHGGRSRPDKSPRRGLDSRRRPGCNRNRAARTRQPAAQDGERYTHAARRLRVLPDVPRGPPQGRPGNLPRPERTLAPHLRQPLRPQQDRPHPLAALLHGTRPRLRLTGVFKSPFPLDGGRLGWG